MSKEEAGVDHFLQTWIEEFGRAVEMFSGQAPSLRCSRTKTLDPAQIDGLLWWKQEFIGDGRFTTWIGAKRDTWFGLGGGGDGAEESEAQSTYLEMLGQAQSGAAHVVSGGLDTPVKCEVGALDGAPDLDTLRYGMVGIQMASSELPALVFAIEPSIEGVINPEEIPAPPMAQAAVANGAIAMPQQQQPMLARLMELELPLSIALGRASMPIREVLKVTSGSVIELDRNVGDSVELLVHGTVVARGEVVSVKGNYGVRIKEIISQQDRMHLYKRD